MPGTPFGLADILEVKAYNWASGQLGLNVGHFIVTGLTSGTPTTAALAAEMDGPFATAYKPAMSFNADHIGIGVRLLDPTVSYPEWQNGDSAGPGTDTGDMMPTAICGIITKKTAIIGRAGRGRVYVPFPSEMRNSDDGHPTAGYTVLLNAVASLWCAVWTPTIPTVVGLELSPIVFHRASFTSDLITGSISRSLWATQHRRGDYGKGNPRPF